MGASVSHLRVVDDRYSSKSCVVPALQVRQDRDNQLLEVSGPYSGPACNAGTLNEHARRPLLHFRSEGSVSHLTIDNESYAVLALQVSHWWQDRTAAVVFHRLDTPSRVHHPR